jgi:UDP-2-acetamido-3-amino-2,3-dideoxy-glucuronate N-acetyltransferase
MPCPGEPDGVRGSPSPPAQEATHQVIDPSARVHATADLEDDVSVGPGTSIWHRAQIRTGARIGAGCIIGRDVFIDEGVALGDRVKVQNAALVYHGVTVEDGVFIGPNAILTNDRYPRAITPTGALARADDWTVSPITLHTGCSIGAGAVVVAGVEIGRFATIGAGAVVTHSVTDHALMVGNPARRLGWVCLCGARLLEASGHPVPSEPEKYATDPTLHCPRCGRRYDYIFDADRIQLRDEAPSEGAPA